MYVSFFLFFNAFAFLKRLQILETFAVTFPIKYRGKQTGTKRKPSYICSGQKEKSFWQSPVRRETKTSITINFKNYE